MTQSIIHQSIAPSPCEDEGDWYGLYKGNTSQDDHLFDPASTRHPAKMSLPLVNRILDEMTARGWISDGSLIVDPFGGRGTTALCWISRHPANRALTVELEPHFVEMQNRNKEHAQRRLHRELAWVILQGDSRRFDEYYAEGKAASVLSPPWEKTVATGDPDFLTPGEQGKRIPSKSNMASYADSAITSAPYSGDAKHDRTFAERDARADEKKDLANACGRGSFRGSPTYGDTPGQIGRLKDPPAASVLSAPYENAIQDKSGIDPTKFRTQGGRYGQTSQAIAGGYQSTASVLSAPYAAAENRRAAGKVQSGEVSDAITRAYDATNHGQTDGQIANLPDACVTSAPYGNQQGGGGKQEQSVREGRLPDSLGAAHRDHREKQSAVGQIANLPDAALLSAPWEKTVASGDPDFLTPGEQGERVPSKSNMAGYADPAAAVTSAPFEDSLNDVVRPCKSTDEYKEKWKAIARDRPGYTDAAAVTSAPYADSQTSDAQRQLSGNKPVSETIATRKASVGNGNEETSYGTAEGQIARLPDNQQGQIGVLQSETYAQACGLVYASLAKAGIRYVASVTKDPVKNKKLRPLRLLTISLFEQAGYRLVAWRRAWLYHTQAELDAMAGQESLFGDEVEESKRLVGRLSFFRRLSLSKGGIASPFEDCLFFELATPEPAVCEHGIPRDQYCTPCDDDYIARQEASPVVQPAQPPRWVQPGLF